jgi:hypothetical protein
MWGKKKLRNNRAGEWSFLNFFFRLEGVSRSRDKLTKEHLYTSKNILENISFDEKKAERNRLFSLSLSLSLRFPKGLKSKGKEMMFHHRGRKGRTK